MTRLTLEDRSARLTILIDPRKKALFERLCAEEDSTPSQVVRRMIRQYILERTGKPWTHFSQNVLTAARAMQQINNQIQNFDSCQK